MYSKKEASLLREQFWTAFGMYMAPIMNADGEKINWINYKTGQKNIRFVMEAGTTAAYIAIELAHKDAGMQQEYFKKLSSFKKAFKKIVSEDWQWELSAHLPDGQVVSRIFYQLNNVNLFDKNDWPALISFFKQRIIALDEFWSEYKFALE